MTYKFEQFKVEITDPIITIDIDSLAVQPSKMTISIDITLEVTGAKFGAHLDNIAVNTLEFLGEGQLMERVLFRLQDFAIEI